MLAAMALAAGAVASVGSGAPAVAQESSEQWDDEWDVVVCGAGGSGLIAAYSAASQGASKVAVYEKADQVGGTTALCDGNLQAGGTKWEEEAGVEDSVDKFFDCLLSLGGGVVEQGLIKTLAESMPEDMEWLSRELGVTYVNLYGAYPVPYQPSDSVRDRTHVIADSEDTSQTGGAVLVEKLKQAVSDLGVTVITGCEVTDLVSNEDGRVVGVVTADGKCHGASGGVVLAAGGLEHGEDLARCYDHLLYEHLSHGALASAATDTGDGIRMGMAVGAQGTFFGPAALMFPTVSYASNAQDEVPYILVNSRGSRFCREDTTYGYYTCEILSEMYRQGGAQGSVWMVLDSKMTSSAQCSWSDEGVREQAVSDGTLLRDETVEGLAGQMGVDPESLARTLSVYDEDAEAGEDLQLGREKQLVALDEPPFYAWKVELTAIGTMGGLLIDSEAAVLDETGQPIKGLFAAGGNSGGWNGRVYAGSGLFLDGCLCWGRRAGASAAAAAAGAEE